MGQLAVIILERPDVAELLRDPMRRAILSLVAERPMTEAQLADELGVSDPSINHHLKLLREAALVKIARREEEAHGIVQKFYISAAKAFFVDLRRMPRAITRYFYAPHLERVRGVLAALYTMSGRRIRLSSAVVEQLAEMMAETVVEVARKYHGIPTEMDREELILAIYGQALSQLIRRRDERTALLSSAVVAVRKGRKLLR